MLLELRRAGGFTGTPKSWRVDAGDDPSWRALVDNAGLQPANPLGRMARLLWPRTAMGHDYAFDLWVDGRRSAFRGVDVTGPLAELVDRLMREGENDSPEAQQATKQDE